MDITECYKILDLKSGATMDDVRTAYKDMVRVWHPDRFAGNPRLRAKANEKLKELNIAYGEIRNFQAQRSETDIHNEEAAHEEKPQSVENKPFPFLKKIRGFFYALLHAMGPGADVRKHLREFMFSQSHPKHVSPEPKRQYHSRLHRSSGPKRVGRKKKRKPFSEVLQEAAIARRKQMAHGEKGDKTDRS